MSAPKESTKASTSGHPAPGARRAVPGNPESVEQLAHDADQTREHLGRMIGELGHRGHRLARKLPAVLAVLALGVIAAGGIALAVRHRQRRGRLVSKLGRLRTALGLVAEKPERLAHEDRSRKIGTAMAVSAGSILAKRLAGKLAARI